jgi:undecaprenyl-diphosphatase
MQFDEQAFNAIYGIAHISGILDFAGIFFANIFPYILLVAYAILLFSIRDWRLRFFAFAQSVVAIVLARGILAEIINFFYYKPRPELVMDILPLIGTPQAPAFPSGHATFFFALAVSIFAVNRRWGWWFFVGAFVNGVARIFVGVHWPLDIAGGMVLGAVSAMGVYLLFRRYKPALNKPEH